MSNKVAGYAGTLTVGGTDYQVTKWSGKVSQAELDITNSSSAGWLEYITGLRSFEGSFDATFDNVINSSGAPFSGSSAAFVLTIGNSSHTLSFTGFVFSISYEVDVAGLATISAEFKATGAVTFS